jgi:hypothetical protein
MVQFKARTGKISGSWLQVPNRSMRLTGKTDEFTVYAGIKER